MRALDRKLLRDLWGSRGMAFAIAAVIGAGISLYVGSVATFDSLFETQSAYYDRYRFAEVFAGAVRVPDPVAERVAQIPGVAVVDTRVVADVTLDVEGMVEPARGRLVSVPVGIGGEESEPRLNAFFLRRGRALDPREDDEVLVNEAFADAHGLGPGDAIVAILNGRRKAFRIVGVALSPEFIYTMAPGDLIPDARRFGILWMARKPLATAFEMDGAWNDVALTLSPGAVEDEVLDRLDAVLERYGGRGAIPRRLQMSHWYLQNELDQLSRMAIVVPTIFLAVAAFLLNLVLTRLVAVQREQIAQLKALGYSALEIGLHFVKWAVLVACLGTAFGLFGGLMMSEAWLDMYVEFFQLPFLERNWRPATLLGALGVALLAAVVGAVRAVRSAVTLPPAEAMRPAAPTSFGRSWVERLWSGARDWPQPVRMIVRNITRLPVRTSLTVLAISLAGSIMLVGGFMFDAIDHMIDLQFDAAQRQDVTVALYEPASAASGFEFERMPGVLSVEPNRSVAARFRFEQRSKEIGIRGLPAGATLERVVDARGRPVTLPPDGLVMSAKLGRDLGVKVGSWIEVEVLEGQRPRRRVPVRGLVDDYVGLGAWMEIDSLRSLLREGETITGAVLQVDTRDHDRLMSYLKETPAVAGVVTRKGVLENFDEFFAENMGFMSAFFLFFATVISFGVVYNGARISLSERNRDLASLRVMGFTRREISFILLGELALLTLISLPLGALIGYGLVAAAVSGLDTEAFRIPLVVTPKNFMVAALTVCAGTAVSALLVRRRLDRLDLIAVLKTRE